MTPPFSPPPRLNSPVRHQWPQPLRKATPLRDRDVSVAQRREVIRRLQDVSSAARGRVICGVREGERRRRQQSRRAPVHEAPVRPSHQEMVLVREERGGIFLVLELSRQVDEPLRQWRRAVGGGISANEESRTACCGRGQVNIVVQCISRCVPNLSRVSKFSGGQPTDCRRSGRWWIPTQCEVREAVLLRRKPVQ